MLHGWALKKVILQSKPTWLGFIVGKKCDPAEIFWKYLKTIIQLELHVKTNLNEKWKIAEYFGENLDILTYLIWIFNNSNWIHNIFSKYFGGIGLLVTTVTEIHLFVLWFSLCPYNSMNEYMWAIVTFHLSLHYHLP